MLKQERFEDLALRLRETDDVAVIKRPVRAGTELLSGSTRFTVGRDIPAGHKIAVISGVNCSASVSQYVKDRFKTDEFRRDFPDVDGVIAFTHKSGCAIQPGEPHQLLMRVLAGIARHPNIAGYVMIGLGCEVNQVQFIRTDFKLDELKPGESAPTFLTIQSAGGVRRTVDAAAAAVT